MEITVVDMTVSKGLCCGCGICSVVCPSKSIRLKLDDDLEYKPVLDRDSCSSCGRCMRVCPFSEPAIKTSIRKSSKHANYGVSTSAKIFQGCDTSAAYIHSSSGGILSALLKSLLDRGEVDCVIHAEQLYATPQDPPYFRASVSRNFEEIDKKRSSFYSPIEFSAVLPTVIEDELVESCCLVAVPCVVTAVALLRDIDPVAASKIKYLFTLVCSHNVNGQFTEGLVRELGNIEDKTLVTFRDKVGITDKLNYNVCIQSEGQNVFRKPRFRTSYTENWRSYAHALECCLYCSDFFGIYADASFKDAWGLSPRFKIFGETVVVANNEKIISVLKQMNSDGQLDLVELNHSMLFESQNETLQFKNHLAQFRIKYKFNSLSIGYRISIVITLVHFGESILKRAVLHLSKWHFRIRHCFLNVTILKTVTRLINYFSRIRVFWANLCRNRDYRSSHFEVLYTAGFGYGNLGDEAQLHANLKNWERLRPDCKITILSPNPDYTKDCHGPYEVIHASRCTLWSGFNLDYFGVGNRKIFMPLFFGKLVWVFCNAIFYKYTRLVFMSPNSAYLLYKLRTADVLHIGGGGFITGKTASRLYDYMALIWLARFFGTEVILSGQTIGVWRNPVQKMFARQLSRATFIGLRDRIDSIKALNELGLYDENKVKVLFDDALFCPSADRQTLIGVLDEIGISIDGYVAINVHYWIFDKSIVNDALDKMAIALDQIYAIHGLVYVMVPMVENDRDAMVYLKQQMSSPCYIFDKLKDFRLAVAAIANAKACITMKHHPIVFAMGGAVPTVSIYFEEYYQHKNIGAMKLFEQEGFAFSHESLGNGQVFSAIDDILKRRDAISNTIRSFLDEYKKISGEIIRLYLKGRFG